MVRKAQEAAIRAVRPGVEARAVDAAARKVIADAGYGDAFNHGLGHGIGLQIHEGPSLRTNSADVLAEGMVFTIEPGIYLPGWGGVRIEDDVRVTADGCEVLTTAAARSMASGGEPLTDDGGCVRWPTNPETNPVLSTCIPSGCSSP